MKSALALTILVVLVALISSNTHLNVKYRRLLNGQEQLSKNVAKQIYNQFRSPYHQKSEYRFSLFTQKLEKIISHNSDLTKSWKKGINEFSDMTFEQFKNKKLMEPQNCSATYNLKPQNKEASIPDYFDWLDTGSVTPVKDQGDCGSCWTFSTVGAMQSHWNILGKGRNVTFSEQQLVDCAWDYNNFGCEGGLPSQAFEYIRHIGGLQTSITYPYTGKDGQCNYRSNLAVGYVRFGSYNITQGDQVQLAERLYNAGPISVSFEVTDAFQDYYSGIYEQEGCGTTTQDVNHAVLATGYGVSGGLPYWNVKNSWGTGWGTRGYFQIIRGKNMCAFAQCNSYPLIDKPSGLKAVEIDSKIKVQEK